MRLIFIYLPNDYLSRTIVVHNQLLNCLLIYDQSACLKWYQPSQKHIIMSHNGFS